MVHALKNPSPQTLHCCMSTWFYVTDNYKNQVELINAGLLKFLSDSWYTKYVKDDTIRIGMSLCVKLIGNTKNYDAFRPYVDGFEKLADFALAKGGDVAKQGKSLKEDCGSVRKGGPQ